MDKKELRRLLNFRMPSKYDKSIHAAMMILIIFGTIMLMSINTKDAATDTYAVVKTVIRQTAFFTAGYIGLLFMAKLFTIQRARKYIMFFIVGCIGLLISCFFFNADYGIHAWIPINLFGISFTLQPSEFSKIILIVYIAICFGSVSNRIKYMPSDVFTVPMIVLVVYAGLILFQDDFGTLAILCFSIAMMCLLLTHPIFDRFKFNVRILCIVVIVLACFFSFSPLGLTILEKVANGHGTKIVQRVQAAQNPFADSLNIGWQLVQGLIAFFNGGWFGVGLGNSTRKYGYLPTSSTDSVLPIVVEETGVVGFMLIAICYFIIIYKLFAYARKINNLPSKMILVGVGSYFFIHFLLNVGGVTALIPFTGVPLLFISNGGSSFLTAMISLGIAQAIISKYNQEISSNNQ